MCVQKLDTKSVNLLFTYYTGWLIAFIKKHFFPLIILNYQALGLISKFHKKRFEKTLLENWKVYRMECLYISLFYIYFPKAMDVMIMFKKPPQIFQKSEQSCA